MLCEDVNPGAPLHVRGLGRNPYLAVGVSHACATAFDRKPGDLRLSSYLPLSTAPVFLTSVPRDRHASTVYVLLTFDIQTTCQLDLGLFSPEPQGNEVM